ncbi:hypothetical protein BO83DRAFT_405929 [Aspergillus eucalypticola CBS 122712]|uniref:Protein kinase domain-containing protein n=1 Tax=Aspergillus eucalypticola (strain CBS 122712 / IBT 29274) TaxID=1448314 RepID=A0A317W4F4_ASPEC|nr:uncharacterized protein BO83DRAFT_405929 [Aspergillus eucalypticola CBS 122712]PWY81454.1 hypothetical protein BO83DRAFT_405929 [Aspergillus eucalypticola CBS 122712]
MIVGTYDNEPSPYRISAVLVIQSHAPPPLHRNEIFMQDKLDRSLSPLELCLQNPPLPGSDGLSFVNIQLTEELQTGFHTRSQAFFVRCVDKFHPSGLLTDHDMIAKFYDPLYHDRDDGSPFRAADYDYSHECASYKRLSELQGTVLPRFFGSYTFATKIDGHSRQIRFDLKPKIFSTEERQNIMKQIFHGESALYAKDARHENLCPCNILIKQSKLGRVRAVIIDLGKSVIGRSRNPSNSAEVSEWFLGVPISPLLRWNIYYGNPNSFEDWIDWPWRKWLEVQYKETESTITDEQRQRWPQPKPTTYPIQPY